jgi:hypothetical protein
MSENTNIQAWIIGEHPVPQRLQSLARGYGNGFVVVRDNGSAAVLTPEAFAADYEWVEATA